MVGLVCKQKEALNQDLAVDAEKYLTAIELLDKLTMFSDSIAGDTSGDGDFDADMYETIHRTRGCLLRWLSMNSPSARVHMRARILLEQHLGED